MATAEASATSVTEALGRRPYIPVFVALGILTLIEIQIPGLGITTGSQITALLLFSIVKGSLVVLYYMHIRYEPRALSLVALIPLGMAIALLVALVATGL